MASGEDLANFKYVGIMLENDSGYGTIAKVRLYKNKSSALISGSTCFTCQTSDGTRYIATGSSKTNSKTGTDETAIVEARDAGGNVRYMFRVAGLSEEKYEASEAAKTYSDDTLFIGGGHIYLYGASGSAGSAGTSPTVGASYTTGNSKTCILYGTGGSGGSGGSGITAKCTAYNSTVTSATAPGGGGGGGGGNGGSYYSSSVASKTQTGMNSNGPVYTYTYRYTVTEARSAGSGGSGGKGGTKNLTIPFMAQKVVISLGDSNGKTGSDGQTRASDGGYFYYGGEGGDGGASGDGNSGGSGHSHGDSDSTGGHSKNSCGGDGGTGGSGTLSGQSSTKTSATAEIYIYV